MGKPFADLEAERIPPPPAPRPQVYSDLNRVIRLLALLLAEQGGAPGE